MYIVNDKSDSVPTPADIEQKTLSPPVDEETELLDVSSCGYGSCKPKIIQGWNNPITVLLVVCLYGLTQGFVAIGIVSVNTATIEKRFYLTSAKAGFIASSYDIMSGLTVIPLSYFGRMSNMPRWLGVSCLIVSFGSLVMASPHFFTSTYESTLLLPSSCQGNETSCIENTTGLPNYLYVFILGQLLHGLGGTTLFTIGTVYLDENVPTHNSPLCIGIFQASTALGPALGFIIGGVLLNIPVDIDKSESLNGFLPSDPRWVGAWWIGYLISAVLAFTCGLLFLCFGRETKVAREVRRNRVSQSHNDGSDDVFKSISTFGNNIKDLPKVTWILLKNPTFLCLSLAACSSAFVIAGFGTFLAKYVQNQFSQTASFSAVLTGVVVIPGAAGALLIGGVISRRLKLKVQGMLKLSIGSIVIAIVASAVFFIRCEGPKIAGITYPFSSQQNISKQISSKGLYDTCNANCKCALDDPETICGIDGIQYFSGCFAGCSIINGTDKNKFYGNCACIESNLDDDKLNTTTSLAVPGPCSGDCVLLPVFLTFLVFVVFFTLMPTTPGISVTLRCVPEKTRTYALGVQWIFIRFLGAIPGPILFGLIMDKSCLVWQEKCNARGSCLIYDNYLMSILMYFLGLGFGIISLIFGILALALYKKPPEKKEDDCVELSENQAST